MNMKWMAFGAAMLFGPFVAAEETPAMPEMPQPTSQHEWLRKFTGSWSVESKVWMEPGKDPMVCTGSEEAEMLGGFWVVGRGSGGTAEMPMEWLISFGYDPQKEAYVGRWIDSMTSQAWDYTGSLDDSGKVLKLSTQGFCPLEGKICEFRTTVEFKTDDLRVITDEKKTDDGWVTAVVSTYTRKP